MGQKKLQRFADIKTFSNVLEYPEEMKGKWNSFFKNDLKLNENINTELEGNIITEDKNCDDEDLIDFIFENDNDDLKKFSSFNTGKTYEDLFFNEN